jgi:carbonic anhydrase-like protein
MPPNEQIESGVVTASFSWEPFGMTRSGEARAVATPSELPRAPRRSLLVLTCMDARIDPLSGFGLRLGDAHVLRNAGAEVTDDVLRSLRLSHAAAGTRDVWLVGHTDCVAHGGSDERVEASLRRSIGQIARMGGLATGFRVRTFRYDLRSGRMTELRLSTDDHDEIA